VRAKDRAVFAAVVAGLTFAIVGPGELMASAPEGMRLSYEITAGGTGQLIANLVPNGTGRYSWKQCTPAGACFHVAGSDGGRVIATGHSPPGTTFIATGTNGGSSVSARSLPYRGVVRATAPPRAAGALRIGALVRPRAARWIGGWGNENDRLQVQVCRTETGGCIVLYDSVNDQRTGRSGATIPKRFRNWFLRIADQRIGRDTLFGPRRTPALALAPHATVSTAILGRISA
jgi:hypothetical protein